MCQLAGLLVGFDSASRRALITRADCDRWACPECAERMRDYWKLRAEIGVREFLSEGLPVSFVTITSHEKLKTFAATEAVWREAWGALYKALKRRADIFEYLIVPERHKDTRMHVHAVWTAGVDKRWLKDAARKRGLGYMADVQDVTDARAVSRYVAKYLAKDLGTDVPKHFRRVRVSRGFPDVPVPTTDLGALAWEYVSGNGHLEMIRQRCIRENYDMIDLGTGKQFDDIDLGTIAWIGI